MSGIFKDQHEMVYKKVSLSALKLPPTPRIFKTSPCLEKSDSGFLVNNVFKYKYKELLLSILLYKFIKLPRQPWHRLAGVPMCAKDVLKA